MARIPRKSEVTRAIRTVGREVKLANKEANQLAAKRLARGDYAGAQTLTETAQKIAAFSSEVADLQSKWRNVGGTRGVRNGGKLERTPLWEFYRPILKVLIALEGEASAGQIEAEIEGEFDGMLKEGDFVKNARGIPRWGVMVRRARKPMIKEGFLSDEHIHKWIITKKGEQAAKKGSKNK